MKSIDETKRFGLTQSLLDAVKSVVQAEADDNRSVDQINASKIALKASAQAAALAAGVGKPTSPGEDDMEPEDVPVDAEPEKEVDIDDAELSASNLDPVDDAENDKDFDDREDQDIDNDGDVDGSDEYLHKRRAATDDAIDAEDEEDQEEGLYADDEDPSDEDSEEEDDGDNDININIDNDGDDDEEDEEESDEDEGDDEAEEDPEANDVPPEMDSDDEADADAEDGEGEDEDGDVETRNIGDMSDDEIEQELAMRRKKSKDEEEVEVNPQMEAYLRTISGDVRKRKIVEGTVNSVGKDYKSTKSGEKSYDTTKVQTGVASNLPKKGEKPAEVGVAGNVDEDDDVNRYPDGSVIGPTGDPDGRSATKKETLSPKQKKLDVNKDGKISGDDLAKIRASKKEQLMASKSYYENKYGNRWETVMDKVAEKLANEACMKRK
jgi:hypothetical protein